MNIKTKELVDDKLNLDIKSLSKEFKFDVCKITKPTFNKTIQNHLNEFILKGFHGEMIWFEETFDRRKSPNVLWPDAKSALVLGINYAPRKNPMLNLINKKKGNISVYAMGEDYHKLFKGKLKQFASKLKRIINRGNEIDFKVFVDTAPIMEKPLAQMAGVGWQGKHTNLVSKEFGSWLFLGVILVNQKLPYDNEVLDSCGTCQSCIDVCPTKAIVKPYKLDARKCISYLTIEYKGKIPLNYRKKIGNRIFGCDDCLAVCPWNKFAKTSYEVKFLARNYNLKLLNLLKLSDKSFRKIFSKSPLKRIGRDRFIRNCCIAAGNSEDKNLLNQLQKLSENESCEIIKESAYWAVQEIKKSI